MAISGERGLSHISITHPQFPLLVEKETKISWDRPDVRLTQPSRRYEPMPRNLWHPVCLIRRSDAMNRVDNQKSQFSRGVTAANAS